MLDSIYYRMLLSVSVLVFSTELLLMCEKNAPSLGELRCVKIKMQLSLEIQGAW